MRRRGSIAVLGSLACAAALSGCGANFHSVFRTTDASGNKVAYTDAKQSATIIHYDKEKDVMRACAAKSPDVFQALSTAFSGNLSAEEAGGIAAKIAGAGSTAESAASFKLHTQLTDSQSELLYQLCINSLNGTITGSQLANELHRYQNTMVTMLGIEQLTGYARPTVVALGGGGSKTGSAEELAKLQSSVDAARTKEESLKGAADKANGQAAEKQAAYDKAKKAYDDEPDVEKKKALKPELDKTDAALKTANEDKKKAATNLAEATKYRQGIEAIRDQTLVDVSTGTTGATAAIGQPTSVSYGADANTAKHISDAVLAMQKAHLQQTFTTDECLAFLFGGREVHADFDTADVKTLKTFCEAHLKEVNRYKFEALYLFNRCTKEGADCKGPEMVAVQQPDGAGQGVGGQGKAQPGTPPVEAGIVELPSDGGLYHLQSVQ